MTQEEDEQFMKVVTKIDGYFHEWLDQNNNILERPISEVLGDCFHAGFNKALKIVLSD